MSQITTSPSSANMPVKILMVIGLIILQGCNQEKAGLHRTYIGQVERGERNISVDSMERLADAIGAELWAMLKP